MNSYVHSIMSVKREHFTNRSVNMQKSGEVSPSDLETASVLVTLAPNGNTIDSAIIGYADGRDSNVVPSKEFQGVDKDLIPVTLTKDVTYFCISDSKLYNNSEKAQISIYKSELKDTETLLKNEKFNKFKTKLDERTLELKAAEGEGEYPTYGSVMSDNLIAWGNKIVPTSSISADGEALTSPYLDKTVTTIVQAGYYLNEEGRDSDATFSWDNSDSSKTPGYFALVPGKGVVAWGSRNQYIPAELEGAKKIIPFKPNPFANDTSFLIVDKNKNLLIPDESEINGCKFKKIKIGDLPIVVFNENQVFVKENSSFITVIDNSGDVYLINHNSGNAFSVNINGKPLNFGTIIDEFPKIYAEKLSANNNNPLYMFSTYYNGNFYEWGKTQGENFLSNQNAIKTIKPITVDSNILKNSQVLYLQNNLYFFDSEQKTLYTIIENKFDLIATPDDAKYLINVDKIPFLLSTDSSKLYDTTNITNKIINNIDNQNNTIAMQLTQLFGQPRPPFHKDIMNSVNLGFTNFNKDINIYSIVHLKLFNNTIVTSYFTIQNNSNKFTIIPRKEFLNTISSQFPNKNPIPENIKIKEGVNIYNSGDLNGNNSAFATIRASGLLAVWGDVNAGGKLPLEFVGKKVKRILPAGDLFFAELEPEQTTPQ